MGEKPTALDEEEERKKAKETQQEKREAGGAGSGGPAERSADFLKLKDRQGAPGEGLGLPVSSPDDAWRSTDPDSDDGIAIGEEGVQRTSHDTSKSVIQNMKREGGGGGGVPAEPAAVTNLNSSRSNIYREGAPGAGVDEPSEPAEGTTVKSSKSNSSERLAGDDDDEPEPAEATNLNSSKSNIYREGAPDDEPPEPSEGTTKSSKSNSQDRMGGPNDPPAAARPQAP